MDMFLTDRKLDRRVSEAKNYRVPQCHSHGAVCHVRRRAGRCKS